MPTDRLSAFTRTATSTFLDNNGSFTTIDPPDSVETITDNINSQGQITGYYFIGDGPQQGFVYSRGTYTTIDPPGSVTVTPESINKAGQIVGVYRDGKGVDHGFLYSVGDGYTALNFPGESDTYALSINDARQVVGALPGQQVISARMAAKSLESRQQPLNAGTVIEVNRRKQIEADLRESEQNCAG